jgi:Rho GTPase-activating protein RGD1
MELFERDQQAVPMVVYMCIQAVDMYGLEVEGIYRIPGTATAMQQMRQKLDQGLYITLSDSPSPTNSRIDANSLDFRNPESFQHDVNSVASLLKQWFRDLPDPLFTREHYNEFIDAARIEDDIVRRDSLHAIINALPDPNYATLRALVFHLYRVQQHAQTNRMSSTNLAICFAPSLMGPHTGAMQDAGLQAKVIDTILQNTHQIFEED